MGTFVSSGITWGGALAMILSWDANHSVFWCIVHSLFSWFYVLYYVIFR